MGQKMRLIYNFIDGWCQSTRYALTPPRYASSLLAGHDAHSIGVLVWQQLVKVSCPLNRRTACLRHFIIPQALPLAPISTPLGFFPCTFSAASPLLYTSQCASPPFALLGLPGDLPKPCTLSFPRKQPHQPCETAKCLWEAFPCHYMYFALAIFLGFRGGFHTWWKWKEDGQPGTMAPCQLVPSFHFRPVFFFWVGKSI